MAGSNDFIVNGDTRTDDEKISGAVTNITSAVSSLSALGARNIVVANRTSRNTPDSTNDQKGQAVNTA